MKAKDYKGIKDYIEKKQDKKQILKGTVICKAKNCDNWLYGNQSTTKPEYCNSCL